MTWRRTAYALILFFISIILLGKFFHSSYHIYILLSILLIFFIYFFTIATEQVLFVGDIDTNKIVGSLTLYILLGLIWAVIYLLIIAFDSNSFTGISHRRVARIIFKSCLLQFCDPYDFRLWRYTTKQSHSRIFCIYGVNNRCLLYGNYCI